MNEGIAQLLEPKNLGGAGHQLAILFKAQQNIPLNALEASFLMNFSGAQANLAYAESLAAVSYSSTDSYGMSDIQGDHSLQRLSFQGNSTVLPSAPPSTPTMAYSGIRSGQISIRQVRHLRLASRNGHATGDSRPHKPALSDPRTRGEPNGFGRAKLDGCRRAALNCRKSARLKKNHVVARTAKCRFHPPGCYA